MALTVGDRLGHYDVTALIGEGGMGQVYQATDTKLKRQVALKILPEAFSADPERLARFQREAEVLASLNHPNIAAIHGLEESDGIRALVLELVEGPTLADRIEQGPIPLDEALPIAKQIAEALEAAHEAGVIHRDLKPANVKVRDDGTVKVLDFGLAKALDLNPDADPSQSPTLTAAATQMGVIMGTAAYMSPEQAAGQTADKRSDIWSFGVVLFEMLTGQRLFTGETVSHVLASVLKTDPNWALLRADTPPAIQRLLRRSLERERKRRLPDAADARLEIEEASTTPRQPDPTQLPPTSPAGWRQGLPWVAGILLAIITGVAVWGLASPDPALPTRFTVVPPTGVQPSSPLVSPDGRMVAFQGRSAGGRNQVYLRGLDQREAVPVEGTERMTLTNRIRPEDFSPDGQWLLLTDLQTYPRMLRRVQLAGGPPVTVGEADNWGATWGPDDTIVYGSDTGLWSMPVAGQDRTQLTTLAEGELGHHYPEFLPNGRAVLFYVRTGQRDRAQVAVYDFDRGERQTLLLGTSPQFASSGHLVFWREEALWAVPFDPDRLEVQGDPLPIEQGVRAEASGFTNYTLGGNGTLVYTGVTQWPRRTLVWVDRGGQ